MLRYFTVRQLSVAPTFKQRRLCTIAEELRYDANFHIPVVNFSKFRNPETSAEKQATADEIVGAFKEVGFVYLKDHGVSDSLVNKVFRKSAQFFNLSKDKKTQLAWEGLFSECAGDGDVNRMIGKPDPRSNRGYVQTGRERVTRSVDAAEIALMRAKAPDSKESMEIGRDWDPTWKNRWPQDSDVPGFKDTMKGFFQTCHDLHTTVLRAVALGLRIEESFFEPFINEQYHNLRLLWYPPINSSVLKQAGQARAGAHSDYGSLTFVFQDSIGGLEVQNPHTQRFHPATPIHGTIVVNVGDLLARWSNDILRSTLHRVVAPSTPLNDDDVTPARQSVAFFCNPNAGAVISCLPNCNSNIERYQPITTEKYIVKRLAETYN